MILTVTLNASVDKLYLLEKHTPNAVMRVKEVRNSAGGKGMNVSRVAARLGEEVTAMGFVGGFNGQYFESLVGRQDRIRRAFTQVASETRCCINCWDLSSGESTEYLEPGAIVSRLEAEAFVRDFTERLPLADLVVFSGSLPRGVPASFYADLIRLCHSRGKEVLLDTSGFCLQEALAACPDFVKPNIDEIASIVGFRPLANEDLTRAADIMHQKGAETVAISLGAEGVFVSCGQGRYSGKPPKIRPGNTVGCGDSMVAGFAVGRVRGEKIEDQIRLAVAVSSASALSIGTAEFLDEDLSEIKPLVKIHRL